MSEHTWNQSGTALNLVVYTPWWIATGSLRLRTPTRLSDCMNNWQDDYLSLEGARIIDLRTGQAETVPRTGPLMVSFREVLLVHEIPTGEAPAQRGGDTEMRVQKRPVPIRALVGPFRVDGDLHLPQHSDLKIYMNRSGEPFLALTNASIIPPVRNQLGTVQIPFALINSHHLLIHGVEEAPLAQS